MPKLLTMVLDIDAPVYSMLENKGLRSTWASYVYPNHEYLYYYGGSDRTYLERDKLYIDCKEEYLNVAQKTELAFNYVLDNISFDFLYRTNLSSFVRVNKLLEMCSNLDPAQPFYGGFLGFYASVHYASGSGYLVSRKSLELISGEKWETSYMDDVSLGRILKRKGVLPVPLERLQLRSYQDAITHDVEDIKRYFHFRCKNPSDRSQDVRIMKYLDGIFNGE